MAEQSTVLNRIKKKLEEYEKPLKILMSFSLWERMVKEENLIGKFCTACKTFLKPLEKHCKLCSADKEKLINKELTILTIEDIPFEVTDRAGKDEIIVV